MEKIINERLVYFLETKGKLRCCQSGFRKGKSTKDCPLCLEPEIRKAQVNKESVVAVFFKTEKSIL